MVLESNIQFHTINKFVTHFLNSKLESNITINEIITAWKDRSNTNKLRSLTRNPRSKPKRVISKYLFFCRDERAQIFKENPGMDIKSVTCELGKRWSDFQLNHSDSERMVEITNLFEIDKKRYDEEKRAINERATTNETIITKKRTKTAYLLFCDKQRETEPKINMKELGIRWSLFKNSQNIIATTVDN